VYSKYYLFLLNFLSSSNLLFAKVSSGSLNTSTPVLFDASASSSGQFIAISSSEINTMNKAIYLSSNDSMTDGNSNLIINISNKFYLTLKSILGFILPDMYSIQNFFSSQYRSWATQLGIDQLLFFIHKIEADTINGFNSTSYDPDYTLPLFGSNIEIELSGMKTAIDNNTLLSNILIYSITFMLFVSSITLLMGSIS